MPPASESDSLRAASTSASRTARNLVLAWADARARLGAASAAADAATAGAEASAGAARRLAGLALGPEAPRWAAVRALLPEGDGRSDEGVTGFDALLADIEALCDDVVAGVDVGGRVEDLLARVEAVIGRCVEDVGG